MVAVMGYTGGLLLTWSKRRGPWLYKGLLLAKMCLLHTDDTNT